MDYSQFSGRILEKVLNAVALINNPEIAPDVRQLQHEILFREVGAALYAKIYDMNAFDFEIEHTKGAGIDDRYFGLAKVAAASVSTGVLGLEEYVKNFLDHNISKAQQDAVKNARQSGKHPIVKRIESSDACKWCQSKAGTFTDAGPTIYERHGGCTGKIITEGYRSRNGLLGNYVKPSDR